MSATDVSGAGRAAGAVPAPPAGAAPGPGDREAGGSPSGRAAWLRRWRWPLTVAALVVLGALAAALLTPRTSTGDLDPDSASPDGSRAVARILEREGVQVSRVTTSTQAQEAAGANRRGTLVVVRPQLLGPEQLRRIAATPADLVLVAPDAPVLDALAPGILPAGSVPARVADPGCDLPAAVSAGRASAGGLLYGAPGLAGADLCYRDQGEAGAPPSASLVVTESDGRRVAVLGQADVLRNGSLVEEGNAALALRLLGSNDSLTWYLPSVEELARSSAPPTLGELLPRWVPWVGLQLAVAVALALLWRARRLGRLVVEPLPVVVRSAETQEGRARLYRRIGARGRAAATLRTATLRRLAARLDVGADATPASVATLVAGLTGREETAVQGTLLGGAPRDDAALVRLADDLDALERAVAGTDRSDRSERTDPARETPSPTSPPTSEDR